MSMIAKLRTHILNSILILTSMFVAFVLFEVSLRLLHEQKIAIFDFRGNIENLYEKGLPVQFDPLLGWLPKEGVSSRENAWGTLVSIEKHSIRSNDNPNSQFFLPQTSILVVGDSYTFGDQVSNHETWPAILEKLLNRKVINAGVFAYGIDQAYLRLLSLLDVVKPKAIIFSFIPHDIDRNEFSTAVGARKPFYTIEEGKLKLNNSPVIQATVQKVSTLRFLLGYSYTIHYLMMRYQPLWWLKGGYDWSENRENHMGPEIACKIFEDLDAILKTRNIKEKYVLIQYRKNLENLESKVAKVKDCINATELNIIDLKGFLVKMREENAEKFDSLWAGHMTHDGNYFVAKQVQKTLTTK